jgi:O-antigen ligase
VLASWALGGNTEWARCALSAWGSLAGVLLLAGWRASSPDSDFRRGAWTLWPLLIFDALVALSLANPNFHALHHGADLMFVPDPALPRFGFLPSTARPDLSLTALWFFNAAYLSSFNLFLQVQRRETLRRLLVLAVSNALVLAIVGTFQQLSGANAPYFGAFKTVQPHFFATFIYHNHWAAYATLMLTSAVGLCFYFLDQGRRRFFNSPGFMALVGVALLALTMPLSTSRSGTFLAVVVVATALTQVIVRILRHARARQTSPARPLVAAMIGVLIVGIFIYDLAKPVIRVRVAATQNQISEMRTRGEYFPRQVLYRDTWALARDRFWFGWGMGSYPTVFYLRNSQRVADDGLPRLFHDAHSDWLQSLSEVGVIGTALLGLCAIVPWWRLRGRLNWRPLPVYLLFGCGMILAYAWLEFPFGNRCVVITFWFVLFTALRHAHLEFERTRINP